MHEHSIGMHLKPSCFTSNTFNVVLHFNVIEKQCISVSAAELNRRRTSELCLVESGNDEAVERIPKAIQRTLKITAVLGKALYTHPKKCFNYETFVD